MSKNGRRTITRVLLLASFVACVQVHAINLPEVHLDSTSRVMILAPHPDDEVLGCAGVIQQAVAKKIPVLIVFLTYGDSNEWSFIARNKRPTLSPKAALHMGELRHSEALAAEAVLGIPASNIVFLGYPDYGTQQMLRAAWRDRPPVEGRLTRATKVPYASAYHPGTPHKPENVVNDLVKLIGDFRPTDLFVSHAADHHPDHAALYVYTKIALWNLEPRPSPRVHPYLIHYPRWPGVAGFDPTRDYGPPAALEVEPGWTKLTLGESQVETKKLALSKHKTQFAYAAKRLLPFVRGVELFGDYRVYSPGSGQSELSITDHATGANDVYVPDEASSDVTSELGSGLVDIDFMRIAFDSSTLSIRIAMNQPVQPQSQLAVYLFGYKSGTDFAVMPKLEIRLESQSTFVYENGKKFRAEKVKVVRMPGDVIIRVPMSALGNPDRLILGGRTWATEVDSDHFPWRLVSLR